MSVVTRPLNLTSTIAVALIAERATFLGSKINTSFPKWCLGGLWKLCEGSFYQIVHTHAHIQTHKTCMRLLDRNALDHKISHHVTTTNTNMFPSFCACFLSTTPMLVGLCKCEVIGKMDERKKKREKLQPNIVV